MKTSILILSWLFWLKPASSRQDNVYIDGLM